MPDESAAIVESRSIRVGLVGFGAHMAEKLYPALLATPLARVVAVASRDSVRAGSIARRHGIPHATGSWRDLVGSGEIDAIVASATPEVHAEIAAEALAAGIGVFVEKPPAPGLRELRALVAVETRAAAATAMVGYNFRFAELIRRGKALIAQSQPLRCVKLRFVAAKPLMPLWGLGNVESSYLYAVGIHAIDLALSMLGPPVAVAASHSAIGEGRFSMMVTLGFSGGRQAVLDLGNYSNRFECDVELIGAAGLVARIAGLRRLSVSGPPVSPLASPKEETVYQLSGLDIGFAATGHAAAFAAFFESLGSCEPSPSPLADSLAVYEVIDECLSCLP